jgi:hypothetical protein
MNLLESKQTKEYDFFGIVKKSHKLKQDDPMIIGSVRGSLRIILAQTFKQLLIMTLKLRPFKGA